MRILIPSHMFLKSSKYFLKHNSHRGRRALGIIRAMPNIYPSYGCEVVLRPMSGASALWRISSFKGVFPGIWKKSPCQDFECPRGLWYLNSIPMFMFLCFLLYSYSN